MPIPGPGTAISMTTIATEFGGTVPHSLSEYYRGGGLVPNTPGNAAIPTSGQIAIGNFYGSANRNQVALTISANSFNYDVYANRGPTYVAGTTDVTVTVNPGVTVGSTSVPTYAMLVPSAFNPGDTVTIVNNGVIQAMGGGGGPGGAANGSAGNPGAGGGSAIYVNRPTVITNNGVVAGGGGGGGGGSGSVGTYPVPKNPGPWSVGGSGGGGGAGTNGGAGGSAAGGGGGVTAAGNPGSAGTSPAGGAGGPAGSAGTPAGPRLGAAGGAGGGRGAAGAAGSPGSAPGGGAGGAGNYIVGNPFVTWPVTGTRQGGVA